MLKLLYGMFALGIAAVSFVGAWFWMDYQRFLEAPITLSTGVNFEIQPGRSIKTLARQLEQQQIIRSARYFTWMARLSGQAQQIKAGDYALKAGSPEALLAQFVAGKSRQYSLAVIEGWATKDLLQAMSKSPHLKHDLHDKTAEDIMAALNYPGHAEGRFYPDTYYFPKGMTDTAFLRRAYVKMHTTLEQEWDNRAADLPLKSAYEALILASIVEKETGVPEERDKVAGVFINRLNKGMRLQTDPTVIYGMGERYKGNIRKKDLRQRTPYNTYVIRGLPPTPIALPGQAAIHATLHPEKHRYLYFVATGVGGHTFSASYKAHNRAVKAYLKQIRKRR